MGRRVLNCFCYTGAFSTYALAGGAQEVISVDTSADALAFGGQHLALNGLQGPATWMEGDVFSVLRRMRDEDRHFDAIILDPPKFGRGPKGEVWEFYKLLPELLSTCRQVLSAQPQFVVLTAYAVKASAVTLYYGMDEMMTGLGGSVTAGEVVLQEKSASRQVAMAIFARWSASERVNNNKKAGD